MKFLHFTIENETGNQVDSIYSNNGKPVFSLECKSKILGGNKFTYKIWNRETNELKSI